MKIVSMDFSELERRVAARLVSEGPNAVCLDRMKYSPTGRPFKEVLPPLHELPTKENKDV